MLFGGMAGWREWACSLLVRDVIDSCRCVEVGYVYWRTGAEGKGEAQREEKGEIISMESSNVARESEEEGLLTVGEAPPVGGELKEKFSNIVMR